MELVRQGRCWKLGHEIPIDGYLLPLEYVHMRLTDPVEIGRHLLEAVDPEFAKQVRPGDVIVAGKRFGHGNPHVQAFRGMSGLGLGVVCEWMPRGAYRCCVVAGVPFLPYCPDIRDGFENGHGITVDFVTGKVRNHTTGMSWRFEPIPRFLLEVIAAGGSTAHLVAQLRRSAGGGAS